MSTADESRETYTVEQIRAAFANYASPDSWNVPCHYEETLIKALRGEFDDRGPK